jgi:hypothetical protein
MKDAVLALQVFNYISSWRGQRTICEAAANETSSPAEGLDPEMREFVAIHSKRRDAAVNRLAVHRFQIGQ